MTPDTILASLGARDLAERIAQAVLPVLQAHVTVRPAVAIDKLLGEFANCELALWGIRVPTDGDTRRSRDIRHAVHVEIRRMLDATIQATWAEAYDAARCDRLSPEPSADTIARIIERASKPQ